MTTVNNVLQTLTFFAPLDAKMDFDNVGLLVGDSGAEVTRVLVALDITSAVIDEAAALGAQLIVSHHPILFSTKNITDTTLTGRKLMALLSHGIAAICMHTNLDAAAGGVNDALAGALGLQNVELLEAPPAYGRLGNLAAPLPLSDFLPNVKTALNSNGLRFNDAGHEVSRVAVVCGGGGSDTDYLYRALASGCDTFVTADVKYNVFLDARELGINLIDADHFCTENPVVAVLQEHLCREFPTLDVSISDVHGQTAQFYV